MDTREPKIHTNRVSNQSDRKTYQKTQKKAIESDNIDENAANAKANNIHYEHADSNRVVDPTLVQDRNTDHEDSL